MPSTAAIKAAFAGTPLDGRTVVEVPVPETGEVGYDVDSEGVDPRTAWTIARPVCAGLGLWPYACSLAGSELYDRYHFTVPGAGRDQRPSAIVRRAGSRR